MTVSHVGKMQGRLSLPAPPSVGTGAGRQVWQPFMSPYLVDAKV